MRDWHGVTHIEHYLNVYSKDRYKEVNYAFKDVHSCASSCSILLLTWPCLLLKGREKGIMDSQYVHPCQGSYLFNHKPICHWIVKHSPNPPPWASHLCVSSYEPEETSLWETLGCRCYSECGWTKSPLRLWAPGRCQPEDALCGYHPEYTDSFTLGTETGQRQ